VKGLPLLLGLIAIAAAIAYHGHVAAEENRYALVTREAGQVGVPRVLRIDRRTGEVCEYEMPLLPRHMPDQANAKVARFTDCAGSNEWLDKYTTFVPFEPDELTDRENHGLDTTETD